MSLLTLEAKLERSDATTPWGFRMQGGKDFSSPLTIQRVNPGSLAAKCGLQTGDIILRIGAADTSTLRHKEAQNSILQAGNHLDLLLQRIRDKRVVTQNGGGAPQRGEGSYETFSPPSVSAATLQNAGSYNSAQSSLSTKSFNAAPKPFNSQQPTPAPFKPTTYHDGLSQQTHNLSLSPGGSSDASSSSSIISAIPASSSFSAPPPPTPKQGGGEAPAHLRSAAEKYSEIEESGRPSQHQSRSFKYLQDLMDSGKEPPKALKTSNPPALHARSVSPVEDSSEVAAAGGPMQVLGQSKPGMVKAIMSQRYNTPIGLYSENEVKTQFQGQSKFLLSEDGTGAPPASQLASKKPAGGFEPKPAPAAPVAKSWAPSTSGPARSPAASVAKAWAPSAPAPATVGTGPFGSGAALKPTGVGAKRGRVGEAVTNPGTGGTGRIPVCSGCGCPIRGPFVTAMGNCWCPDHFVCANPQCGVKLIDIGFVEEGGNLYCERDYERYLAPHCKKCNTTILGECVNALQATWHPDCFLCTQCKLPIGGNQFHIEEGKPYCEKDWASMFQTMCAGCDFPIEPGDRWVEAMGKNFHAECFNCATCQVSLEGQPFVAKAGKAYCKKHAR
ncbi:PDZ and LIM domain protein 7-like isoform X8 [Babylonia areolata]|uniref:PDZ and LIM domain protein 7-like isoform X8 n=1 Tax=Babylonia areolata TaxID=304850 RepID=UPI003FD5520A